MAGSIKSHPANPKAFFDLGKFYGYEMVYCERNGVNCFLVHKDAISAATKGINCHFPKPNYHYPAFHVDMNGAMGHKIVLETSDILIRPTLELIEKLSQNAAGQDDIKSHIVHASNLYAEKNRSCI